MNTPEWLKPTLWGAAGGAIALAVVGFAWGGWMTGSSANEMAQQEAKAAVVIALVPICVAQSRADPEMAAVMASLQETTSYRRREALMETGWATMPGSEQANRDVAEACMKELAKQF